MTTSFPFTKCLHPKRIINPYTKESVLVPCGVCESCMLQKSAMNTLKLKLECENYMYNEFVTLTYSDEFVPQCAVIRDERSLYDEEFDVQLGILNKYFKGRTGVSVCDCQHYLLVDITDRFGTEGAVLGESWMYDLDYFSLRNKIGYGNVINVLRYEDVQLFLKRFRKQIFKLYGEKIRFYCCGEYGPEHYRPHWHLILSYNSRELAQNIRQIISSCWTYGRIDSSKSRGKCSSYVASYVNCCCNLPSLYRTPTTKPCCHHSTRLGEAFCKSTVEEIYQQGYDNFSSRCIILNGVPTEFNLWRSLTLRYFPRCKGFSVKSNQERVEAYRIKAQLDKYYGIERTPYEWALCLSDTFYSWSQLDTFDHNIVSPPLYYFVKSNNLNLATIFGSVVDKDKLFNSIYHELYVSDYFLKHISKSSEYLPCLRKIQFIDQYYKDQELSCLNRYYRYLQDYVTDKKSFDDCTEMMFMPDSADLDFNPLYTSNREVVLKTFNNSIKYKKLNDKYNVRRDNNYLY